LQDLIAETYFKFLILSELRETHKKQCAIATKCATCTHVRMFFCRPPSTKFCRPEWTFQSGRAHAQVSQS